ncbi:MAG TPA: hypothetical protein DDW49_08400 [Deltaproteobacteria bacterium]|nr:MAG: hypothetical protein A2048_08015 [Deltaproteobacteria bacterium GWA2_45_12]HBF13385.1 hypothetical protein [Deltaproteobacteria bacterium]
MFKFSSPRKKHYDYEQVFKKIMLQLETLERGSDNIDIILRTVLNVVEASHGSLFVYQSESNTFILKKWLGEKPINVSIAGDYEFINYLKQTQSVVLKDETVHEQRYVDIRSAAVHYFTQISCVAVVPLILNGQWVALLNVGRSLHQSEYQEDDKTILHLLAYWLAHNISNALLYNRVINQNKKLAEMTELKSQLMANVTHELRTPLNGILGMTDLIMEEADGPINEDQKRHLSMIKSAGESLLEIVDNILSLIKVESHKQELDVKKINISKMIQEVALLFEGIITSKNNEFQCFVHEHLPIYGDEEQVRIVLMNLLGNAVKFTDGGQIEVHVGRSGEMAKICVKDTGVGIQESDHEKIFEEFCQGNGSIERTYGGAGLGLSVAKKIVELHGGRIWVDSILGKGSEFYFTLPTKPA